MYQVIKAPNFDDDFSPNNPLLLIASEQALKSAEDLARQIDDFTRYLIKKVASDEVLNLFIEAGKPFPGLDLRMEMITVTKRRITLLFRQNELGKATFETKFIPQNEGFVIIHEVTDVWL